MFVFLFGGGGKPRKASMSRGLYDQQKAANALYPVKDRIAPGKGLIYVAFAAPEPFLTPVKLNEQELSAAAKLLYELTISEGQACELVVAKKTKTVLYISGKQAWFADAAKKAGVKTEVYR